jgi:hypothetical protein
MFIRCIVFYTLAITEALYSSGTMLAPVAINFTVINEATPANTILTLAGVASLITVKLMATGANIVPEEYKASVIANIYVGFSAAT